MRFAFVVMAALGGWLWYAVREPAAPTPEPVARVRRADLGDLHAQVAAADRTDRAATGLAEQLDAAEARGVEHPTDESIDEQIDEVDGTYRDGDLGNLAEMLALAEARAEEELTEDPAEDETIGHEIISIEGSAPIIDASTTTHCGISIETDYVRNIPTGRTFSAALGGAADEFTNGEPVTFTGTTSVENTYYVEDISEDVPAIDDTYVIED